MIEQRKSMCWSGEICMILSTQCYVFFFYIQRNNLWVRIGGIFSKEQKEGKYRIGEIFFIGDERLGRGNDGESMERH